MHSASPSTSSARGGRGRGRGGAQRTGSTGRDSATREMALPVSTVTSSLDIPVEGATPIGEDGDPMAMAATPVAQTPTYESKRAPRKSKTEAMAAINQRSTSPDTTRPKQAATNSVNLPSLRLNPRFDLGSVKTRAKTPIPARTHPPYIRSIHDKAVAHGIIKIIPPVEWEMPFVCDSETFRFKTRLQRLNSIEASSRAKMSFLEQLYRYHEQGASKVSVPMINHQPLDLWLLRREVQRRGGYDVVSRNKLWGDVQRAMGYSGPSVLAAQLKTAYTRIISPYEYFRAKVRHEALPSQSRRVQPSRTRTRQSTRGGHSVFPSSAATPPSSPLTPSSSPLSEPPDDSDPQAAANTNGQDVKMKEPNDEGASAFNKALAQDPGPSMTFDNTPILNPLAAQIAAEVRKGETCEICKKSDRDTEMLLCDGCDEGFHMSCLDPPLNAIPKGSWFCHECMFGNNDYGFDEGEEHSLTSFQARDLAFRKQWFESHPPPDPTWEDPTRTEIGKVSVTEDDVEREFWRLVQSSHETVEVEYGADVHSTTHGSAMPSVESHPRDPYSRDPWNVNNLPILQDSMLRYIKSDISGMTVPWTYVGMLFSTFCWHNEDHYTYSLNYMHWGETKTWYGIPGEDAQKFEDAIKSEAPDLFEAQPDLLFQLVTLMNPDRLRKAGVRVVACNQRPGEFVVTFPKAYHAGFNHGFNFNEAVNFAPPEWLPLGLECARRYRDHRKLPVFSHDELLVTITQHAASVKNAGWLYENLKEMVDRELEERAQVRALVGRSIDERLDDADSPEEAYQCAICKGFCYLSQVTCQCTQSRVCLSHVPQLCNCHISTRILHKRFEDQHLLDMLSDVEKKAQAPAAWRSKFAAALDGPGLPALGVLQELASEGEKLDVPMVELKSLQRCVKRAATWTEEATDLLNYVPPRKRQKVGDSPEPEPRYSVNDINKLLDEIRKLGVDAPETARLEQLDEQVRDFQRKTKDMLRKLGNSEDAAPLAKFEELIAIGKGLRLKIDELGESEKLVARLQFFKELQTINDNGLTLDQVEELILRGYKAGVSSDHRVMVELTRKATFGGEWKARAVSILAQRRPTMQDLNQLVVPVQWIPTLPDILDKLDRARMKGREFEKKVETYLRPPRGTQILIDDANKLALAALKEVSFHAAEELRVLSNEARLWEKSCEDVMLGRFKPRGSLTAYEEIRSMKDEGKAKFWAFRMPWFEDMTRQLAIHDDWVSRLPWNRQNHPLLQLEKILEDVTSDRGSAPPTNEACTCICVEPVAVPEPGEPDAQEIVQCDHCLAKFHAKCIEGSCPFCDHHHWNGSMPGKARTFKLSHLITQYKAACDLTRHYSFDYNSLGVLIRHCDALTRPIDTFIKQLGQQGTPDPAAVPQIRHFMRKLYRIQFDVQARADAPAYGLSLAHLHRQMAMQQPQPKTKRRLNRKPKFVFKPEVDPKAADGSRCLCGGAAASLKLPLLECSKCQSLYHVACVALQTIDKAPDPFVCPLCLLKKGKSYGPADVRVRYHDDDPEENAKFVDVKACLDNYSWKVIRRALPPPIRTTITVQLLRFVPGTNPDIDEPEVHHKPPSGPTPTKSTPQRPPATSGSGSGDTPSQPVVRRVRLRIKGDVGDDHSDPTTGPSTPRSALNVNGANGSPTTQRPYGAAAW
ncbi:histone demethylase JARID1 [Ceratobasidium sp. AG-Ba]|nr:histone demethylase JARID1 [Ceratobasidium sp. AG-Ba]